MKVINVSLTVQPGKQAEYEAFIDKLVQGSLAEAGNLDYGHFKNLAQITNMKSSNTGKMLMLLNHTTEQLTSKIS